MAATLGSYREADAVGARPTIGAIVLAEGLKMRLERQRFPDRPDSEIFRAEPGWFDEASARRAAILHDIRAVLNADDAGTAARFTTGIGPAGIRRETTYAGWLVTGYWLSHGETYTEIAHVAEKDAPARVAEAIDKLLAEPAN